MPDFDIDFCETHRDKVISYVQRKYGRDKVAQIITSWSPEGSRGSKDTGRVLQMSACTSRSVGEAHPEPPD